MTKITDTKNLIVGQLLKHSWINDDGVSWEYVTIKYVFDDEIVVHNGTGKMTAINIGSEAVDKLIDKSGDIDHVFKLLLKDGVPVVSKKNFFGKYTCEPYFLYV